MRTNLLRGLVCFCLLAALVEVASAQSVVRTEIHPIATQTLSGADFLNGKQDAPRAMIGGELRIPTFGNNRLPAVVLVHGSGGVGSNVVEWAAELNRLGVAVFILDTFTGRGITSTVADQTLLSSLAMLYDSYRALELLAKHPRIDPERIAIMGFSKGAVAALYSSMTRFHEFYGPKGVQFAAHLAFYAPCNVAYIDDTKLAAKPIRLFHGIADDYVPVAPCRDYAARLKRAGVDVVLHEYPDAHHGFDASALRAPVRLAQAITARKCRLAEEPRAALINSDTGKPFDMGDSCLERGTTVAHNAEATASARRDVGAFLKALFKL
jgi:dienelactone hydrolase